MNLSLRKFLLPLHLWSGLTLGLILMVMAVSGALLTFRSTLEPKFDSQRFVVPPGTSRLAPEDLIARALAVHPASKLESIRYYGNPTAPFLVYFANRDYVHLNPYTGAVLGIRQRYGEGFGWIEGLHKFMRFSPTVGKPITGYTSLVFAFIIVSGIVLWWPATRRALKAGLTINRKLKGRPRNLNWHKTLGILASVVILFSSASGVPISIEWAKNALYPLTGSRKPDMIILPASATFVGFNHIAQELAGLMPGARETNIPLPIDGVVRAYAIEAGAGHPNARSYAWFEPAGGRLIKATPYAQAKTGFRLYYWMMSLHTGVLGGPIMQIIFILGALTVPILAYTGTASYLRRRFRRSTSAVPAKIKVAVAPMIESTQMPNR